MVAEPVTEVPSQKDLSAATRGRALLEDHFDLIQRKLRHLGQRSGLPEIEAEEFRSWALLRLVEDDYRILTSWQGRSSLPTYLTVVLVNLMRDYRIHVWGKWRASASARRRGREGVLLERLWVRDGLPLDEAIAQMWTEHGVTLSRAELERIAAGLPRRAGRRRVGEEELLDLPAHGHVEERVEERERAETAARLQEVLPALLRVLPAENRQLIELYYRDGLSMAAIARDLGKTQRELYSLRNRCLKRLRQALEAAGLNADRVSGLAGRLSWEFHAKGRT
jgi:RNA polymerase sigma factor (sigma-70 family)